MCVSLCVCLGIGGQRRDFIFRIFELHQIVRKVFFCLFWCEDHTKIWACKPARPEVRGKKDKGCWLVRSGRPAVRESTG